MKLAIHLERIKSNHLTAFNLGKIKSFIASEKISAKSLIKLLDLDIKELVKYVFSNPRMDYKDIKITQKIIEGEIDGYLNMQNILFLNSKFKTQEKRREHLKLFDLWLDSFKESLNMETLKKHKNKLLARRKAEGKKEAYE